MPVKKSGESHYDIDELMTDVMRDAKVKVRLRENMTSDARIRQLAEHMMSQSIVYELFNVVAYVIKDAASRKPESGSAPQPAHAAAQENFVETGIPGVQYASLGEPTFLNVPTNFSVGIRDGKVDVHPADQVGFSWAVKFRLAENAEPHQVGTVQTVTSVNRYCELRPDAEKPEKGVIVSIILPQPANDRHQSSTLPWYSSSQWFGPQTLLPGQTVEARPALVDRPGYEFELDSITQTTGLSNLKVIGIRGQDNFATWVILRNMNSGAVHYLYHYTWFINYGELQGQVALASQGWGKGGESPVLDGTRAVEMAATQIRDFYIEYEDEESSEDED